ncbi:retrovirus-related pol polyprotein from transposon TNT 1-94 [Tanacetum coccineum]|uniref:Retrovirus-related pol polyprotein from transposon TNT 1-94 n=1 Tax=Tanacetum coccineum TaxID=301880 RepID=A0ABQ5GVQ6_9ASTR
MFMANLSSADPVCDEADQSYDSDVLSEVQDHDHYQDAICDHHEEHEMHDDVQPNHVVDSHANYTSDSNMTPYDEYVKDNAVPVVQNNASMVPNDAYVMIDNDVHKSDVLSVSHTPRNTVVNNSLNAELATYKEQVELYERRARFELTEREQKIDEQLRIVICDRNIKEENLKKELHSVKLQLASTIQHNKLMVDEVTSLKKDFNQKENKYLEEFLDLKALKDKVEDKLFKQGQSIQTVHMMCKPRSYYDEVNKVAIGYKNPLCLHRARQVQPALYSGHVIVTPNHAPAVVRDCEETLEQSEISRKKMHDKMKANACVDKKVNITPPNYSKENFLATFTPQKQLTPEQLFWSQDIVKMKAEALKEQNTRPIKALTVYPPNTPATLVPRVLPTKSQVKINIFTLRQLFSEFEKTCKKRITPTGITEGGKRGYEPKQDMLPSRRNMMRLNGKTFLLNMDNNIIADGLSKEVFYVASNSELNVFRFTEMQKAHHVVKARCLELEAELSNLRDDVRKDNYNDLLNRFSNLEVNHLNLQLKYQNLKDSFQNKPSSSVNDTPDFNSVFVIGQMKASLQGKDNVIQKLKMQISQFQETRSELDRPLDLRARDFQISQLTEKVNSLQEQNELFRAENAKIKQHYKELYDSIKITRAKHTEQTTALKNENESLKVQIQNTVSCVTTTQVVQIVLWYLDSGCSKHMTGDRSRLMNFVKKFIGTVRFGNDHFGAIMGYGDYVIGDSVISRHSCYVRDTDGVELLKGSRGSNLYTISVEDMMKSSPICLLSKASKNKSWLWHRRLNHLNFGTINDLARKDLVRGLPRLKFEKDHLCSACQLGKSKKHTHKPKTKNTNLEVLNTLHMDLCGPMRSGGLNKTVRFVRTDNGTEFVNKNLTDYYESVGITHEKTVPRTPQQNGVVERRNRTLVEAARTMLIFSKAPLFLWAEAVATACYTQNRSLIHTLHNKTPYELVHDKKPDLSFLRIFGALCYPTNDSEDLGKLKAKADIGFFVGYAPNRKGYRIYNKRTRQIMETIHVTFDELTEQTAPVHSSSGPNPNLLTPGPISSGLVPNSAPAIPYVPPTNKDLELLFQPMFDEYFETPTGDHQMPHVPAVPPPVIPTGPSVSISFDHDAPSGSHSPSSSAHQSSSVHHGVATEHSFEVNPFAATEHEPFVNVFALDPHLLGLSRLLHPTNPLNLMNISANGLTLILLIILLGTLLDRYPLGNSLLQMFCGASTI